MTTTSSTLNVGRLLDRQANLWEIRRRLADEGGEPARREFAHLKEGPWVTISKSLGSGWKEVADAVADELGWQIFDHEILEEIARHAHAREVVLSRLDEHDRRWLEDTLARLASPDDPGQLGFLIEMKKVIIALGKQGRTILVGRGANWLLDPAYGLRVRINAPRERRIARLQQRDGVARAEAARHIDRDDQAKARFIHQVYHHEIDDPAGYDLMMNLDTLGPDAAAGAILSCLRIKLGAA